MSRIVYVNGKYLPYNEAYIHPEDRGFQFADGVYEVCEVRDGYLIDETRHMQRLERSMRELSMTSPMSLKALGHIMRETIRRNKVKNGAVYLQVTRGAARRDFIYPDPAVRPTTVCIAWRVPKQSREARAKAGISVITMPDIRWRRPDIKTVSLLPNAMAKQAAKEAGAKEAWLVDANGYVTEGSSSNAWIVTKDKILITRPTEDYGILKGITRGVLMDLLNTKGISFEERSFSVDEAKKAAEAFLTSASNGIMPIIRIDDEVIADGKPGAISLMLREQFYDQAEFSA